MRVTGLTLGRWLADGGAVILGHFVLSRYLDADRLAELLSCETIYFDSR